MFLPGCVNIGPGENSCGIWVSIDQSDCDNAAILIDVSGSCEIAGCCWLCRLEASVGIAHS